MAQLRRQVVIVLLCLVAVIAAKIYVDRVMIPGIADRDVTGEERQVPEAVTVEVPQGPELALP